MSVSGEIENLEYEIKQQENKLEDLKKRLDKLLMIRPMSDEERQRAKEKDQTNSGQPLKKKQVWKKCVSCGGPAYNDICGFCLED